MVTTRTESGWQGTEVFLRFLAIIWEKNHGYLEKINESRDTALVLKSLSDYYYGLRNLKSVLIFFIEADPKRKITIDNYFEEIKTRTNDRDLIMSPFNQDDIIWTRNKLLDIQDELFRVMGSSKLLVPITIKKQYDSMEEEIDEDNA